MSGIAITFPSSAVEGQSYLAQNGFTYIYDSQKNRWKRGGEFVRAPKVLSYAGVAATTTGAGITTSPTGSLIYVIPGTVIPSSDVGIDSYKAYRTTDSYPNYTEIQVSISSAFSSVAYAATSTSTTFSIPSGTLSGNTTYYVRARQFVGSNASAASTGAISGYSQNIVQFTTASVFLDAPTIVSIAATTRFPVYQVGFAGTTLPATVTYTGSGVTSLTKVDWRVTGPRIPSSTGDTALAEVGIGTFSSATLANALVLAMPFSGASGVGITSDVNNAIRTASSASAGTTKTVTANGGIGTASVGIATTTAHFYPSAANFTGPINTQTTSFTYLSTPNTTDFDMAGDFTWECWAYPRQLPSSDAWPTNWWQHSVLFGRGTPGLGDGYCLILGATKLIIQNSDSQIVSGNHNVAANNWYHFAATRSGSIVRIFVNGVLVGSASNSSSLGAGSNFYVGGETGEGAAFNGYLQDLKIYKGLAKYTENFTPPLPTYGTISYTTGDAFATVGVATTAFFESTGDTPTAEVAIGSSTAAQVASSLVLAMPMNRTFGFQDINVAVRGLTSGASAGTAKTVGLGTTSTANAPSQPIISSTESKWYDGAAYFDGGDYAAARSSSRWFSGVGSTDFTIETWVNPSNSTTNSLFQITHPDNDNLLYGNFTNVTSSGIFFWSQLPWTFDGNVENNTHFNTGGANYSGFNISVASKIRILVYFGGFGGTATVTIGANGSTIATFSKPGGTDGINADPYYEANFTGTLTSLTITCSGLTSGGGVNEVLVAAIYVDGRRLIQNGQIPSPILSLNGGSSAGLTLRNIFGTSTVNVTGGSIPTNSWSHLAATLSGSTLRLFVNGNLVGTGSTTGIVTTSTFAIVGGSDQGSSNSFLTGHMQDLKFYNGFAKYTANFTPPAPICGFTTDISTQTGFTTTTATGALLSSTVGLGTTSTLAFSADQNLAGVTSITSSSGITTLPDPYAQNLVLALPLANITGAGNSFTNDRNTQIRSVSITGAGVTAGTTKTITNTGVTTSTSVTKYYGNTASFNGSSNYLSTPNDTDFNFGSGDFTIEAFVNINALGTGKIITNYIAATATTGNDLGWIFGINTSNQLEGVLYSGSSAVGLIQAGSLTTGRWYHVSYVRKSSSFYMFLDGQLIGTATGSASHNTNSGWNVSFGYGHSAGTQYMNGYLQDVRIYKGVAKYTTNFTPPPPMFGDYTRSTPNKLIFTPSSDYVLEARNTSGVTTSSYSATRQWGTKPKGGIYDPYASNLVLAIPGGAVGGATTTFDVTGQIRYETPTATYVNAGIVTYSNSLGIGTYQNKTVTNTNVSISSTISKYYSRSLYFNANGQLLSIPDNVDFQFGGTDFTIEMWIYPTLYSGYNTLIAKRQSTTEWEIFLNTGTGALSWYNGATLFISSTIPALNTWSHVAATSRNGIITLYLNGINVYSFSYSTPSSTNTVYIGGITGEPFYGYMNDVRIYKGVAKYTSNFTPPNQIYLT